MKLRMHQILNSGPGRHRKATISTDQTQAKAIVAEYLNLTRNGPFWAKNSPTAHLGAFRRTFLPHVFAIVVAKGQMHGMEISKYLNIKWRKY